jgi:drug/metabolite transporter (DMT)-like permease
MPIDQFRVSAVDGNGHVLLFLKSLLVGISWTFAYFSLKELPVSIAGPLRALGPAWTIVIATTFMNERPSKEQWLGILIVLASFYAFSRVGRREGIHFHRNRGVTLMVIATILGACSGLYDKYLLQNCGFDAPTVQAWFSMYLVIVLFPLVIYWYVRDRTRVPFQWRPAIPLIAIMLLIADFLYFTAITDPDALISIISPVRRCSVVVSFLIGVFFYGEKNFRPKARCLAALLLGVFLMGWG